MTSFRWSPPGRYSSTSSSTASSVASSAWGVSRDDVRPIAMEDSDGVCRCPCPCSETGGTGRLVLAESRLGLGPPVADSRRVEVEGGRRGGGGG